MAKKKASQKSRNPRNSGAADLSLPQNIVLFGEQGIAQYLTPGKIVCDLSSVTPGETTSASAVVSSVSDVSAVIVRSAANDAVVATQKATVAARAKPTVFAPLGELQISFSIALPLYSH